MQVWKGVYTTTFQSNMILQNVYDVCSIYALLLRNIILWLNFFLRTTPFPAFVVIGHTRVTQHMKPLLLVMIYCA